MTPSEPTTYRRALVAQQRESHQEFALPTLILAAFEGSSAGGFASWEWPILANWKTVSKFKSDRFSSKHDRAIMEWARLIHEATRSGRAAPYFLTLTFDRYDDRYLVSSDRDLPPTKEEVMSGLTCRMPPSAALDRRHADIRRFFIRLCRKLLGRNWAAMSDLQPRGIGWLDRPCFKTHSKRSARARHPGDIFEHAHIGLIIPNAPRLGREASALERFEELLSSELLTQIWRRFNVQGEVHVGRMWDPYGALDYSAKTAKTEDRFSEYMIILPSR